MTRHVVPLCLAPALAPDLASVASEAGWSLVRLREELLRLEVTVERLGFLPGFAYMTGLPDALHLPRRATPRSRVPAGSVAIANGRLGIYPVDSPGGWHLVGTTPLCCFDPLTDPPARFLPGDTVVFREIAEHEVVREERPAPPRTTQAHAWVEVRAPGTQTTVEDAGRYGAEAYGVAPGGASDRDAMTLANALVGNAPDAAVLEILRQGPVLAADVPLLMAVAGAVCPITVDGRTVPSGAAFAVPAGAEVRIGAARLGLRPVLAIGGGLAVPPVLGSRSTHRLAGFGGYDGRALERGDSLPIGAPTERTQRRLARLLAAPAPHADRTRLGHSFLPSDGETPLHLVEGPAFATLPADVRAQLAGAGIRLQASATSDRMGLRLEPSLAPGLPGSGQAPSVPVTHGTVQLPPDGAPIILGADHQTTGGYPILGTLIAADRSALAQLRPGAAVRLRRVDAEAAACLDAERARDVAMAIASLNLND